MDKIKEFCMKNLTLTKDIQIFICIQYCWCGCCFMIQYSIYNKFFVKILFLKLKIEEMDTGFKT